jgi:hypothetical protein
MAELFGISEEVVRVLLDELLEHGLLVPTHLKKAVA